MRKSECEAAIRQLAHDWASGQPRSPGWHPSFTDFKEWLGNRGFGHYLDFRSVMPAVDEAERWFDQELRQTSRN